MFVVFAAAAAENSSISLKLFEHGLVYNKKTMILFFVDIFQIVKMNAVWWCFILHTEITSETMCVCVCVWVTGKVIDAQMWNNEVNQLSLDSNLRSVNDLNELNFFYFDFHFFLFCLFFFKDITISYGNHWFCAICSVSLTSFVCLSFVFFLCEALALAVVVVVFFWC